MLLDVVGCCCMLLAVAMVLDVVGVVVGCCWILLDVARCC